MSLLSINPATNELINEYPVHSDLEINHIITSAAKAQISWQGLKLNERLDYFKKLSKLFKKDSLRIAKLITLEMGKPISQSIAEIEKCASLCDYYYQNSAKILREINYDIIDQKSFISYQPIGIVLGIMPWNFPFWQVFRFLVPTLIVGNGAILKHASNVQGCADEIENYFNLAGFPQNIFCNIRIPGKEVSKIIKNPSIAAVSLTGSEEAGISVAKTAGSVLKKTVLELGGNDPYIIFSDANLEISTEACINGRILNAGQSCISAKRIIVMFDIYNDFLNLIKNKLSKKIVGNPMDKVDMGPMVSIEARDEVHDQVLRSQNKGAKIILGGFIPNSIGAYYPITLLSDVKPEMPAFDEEIFGPVFSLIKAKNEEDAINLANLSNFGLGASIFTNDIEKGEQIAKTKIFSGSCFVNDFVKSDPRLPFGGIKKSGYGRELASQGMLEFVNIKTIVVKNSKNM